MRNHNPTPWPLLAGLQTVLWAVLALCVGNAFGSLTLDPLDLPKADTADTARIREVAEAQSAQILALEEIGDSAEDCVGRELLTTDPMDQFWNPYSYVGGSPLMGADPEGLEELGPTDQTCYENKNWFTDVNMDRVGPSAGMSQTPSLDGLVGAVGPSNNPIDLFAFMVLNPAAATVKFGQGLSQAELEKEFLKRGVNFPSKPLNASPKSIPGGTLRGKFKVFQEESRMSGGAAKVLTGSAIGLAIISEYLDAYNSGARGTYPMVVRPLLRGASVGGFGYIGGNIGGALGALPIFTVEGAPTSLFTVPAGVAVGGITGGKLGAYFFDQTEGGIQSLMHK